jgi:hypothetical protein
VVKADSGIESFEDLTGKTIAVWRYLDAGTLISRLNFLTFTEVHAALEQYSVENTNIVEETFGPTGLTSGAADAVRTDFASAHSL